ncbi:HIT family protein [Archaeoglobus veneficus]|uniref:Histidine triad (HIT) protein n=1 Tax=Archaeoglobus veneficus (strain DSM 11195 / SNP6) TaxID=693661 RepID=F2KTA9_ARCVS|nr:HIT domain-containing protein [Archaeoglobus veneficus]AEA47139.1 histidine triad (HIT) protein [Archaeoglobus veneficus SNP6]
MERLFAPWRIRYILAPKYEGCIFCDFPKQDRDKENLILYRGKKTFIMMNRYPYNPGHVLVSPYRHVAELSELEMDEKVELIENIDLIIEAIRRAMNPDGFNVGLNIGKVAGAGMEAHLHFHVVPRWNGDTSFMPVFADVQVVPEALEETYDKLKEAIESIKRDEK